jgi:hypothetical protein
LNLQNLDEAPLLVGETLKIEDLIGTQIDGKGARSRRWDGQVVEELLSPFHLIGDFGH